MTCELKRKKTWLFLGFSRYGDWIKVDPYLGGVWIRAIGPEQRVLLKSGKINLKKRQSSSQKCLCHQKHFFIRSVTCCLREKHQDLKSVYTAPAEGAAGTGACWGVNCPEIPQKQNLCPGSLPWLRYLQWSFSTAAMLCSFMISCFLLLYLSFP